MNEQIKQVCNIYLSQRHLWWAVGAFAIVVSPNAAMMLLEDRKGDSLPVFFVLGMPMVALLPFLVGIVKMQFAHPRVRLVPHFLPAHLFVLSGILLGAMIVYPAVTALAAGVDVLGPLALVFAIGAPAIWGAQLNRFWPMLISIVAFFSTMGGRGTRWWVTEAPLHRWPHAAILITGIVLVCLWLRRLCVVDEESEDYQNNYQAFLARRTGSEAIEQRRVVANAVGRNPLMSRIGDWWHSRLGKYRDGDRFGTIRLLRYGGAATPTEFNALIMLGIFVAYTIFITQFTPLAGSRGAMSGAWFFLMFLIFIPGMMAGEMLAQRRPRIANELFLPMTRKKLVDGLLASSAYNSIVQWLIMNVGLAILVFSLKIEVTLQMAAMYLLLSGATTLTAMAIGMRIAVWPSQLKRLFVGWLTWMVLLPPFAAWWTTRDDIGDAPFLIAVGVLLAVAAVVLNWARKSWLELELG